MINNLKMIWRRQPHLVWKHWRLNNSDGIDRRPAVMICRPAPIRWDFHHVCSVHKQILPEAVWFDDEFVQIFHFSIAAQRDLSSISIKSNTHSSFERPRPGSFGTSGATGLPASSFGNGAGYNGKSSFPTSSSSGSLAPPPANTSRNLNRTKANETDLISFAHPVDNNLTNLLLGNDSSTAIATVATAAAAAASETSLTPPSTANDSHTNFKQMVDEIHR